MEQNAVIMLLLGIAGTSILFVLGIWLYPRLRNSKQGYPLEDEIEPLLLPLIFAVIQSVYKLSEKCVDDLHQRLKGVDKKRIADEIYDWPQLETFHVGRYSLKEIKQLVPRKRFEELVHEACDRSDHFFNEHQKYFDEQFEEWKATNAPSASASHTLLAGSTDS